MLIDGLAREGKGVIYASGEFAELVGLCDRISRTVGRTDRSGRSPARKPGKRHCFIIQPEERQREQGPWQ
ncbi:hypothetical protein LNP05_10700 [Klebsiella pneumoniae subsp. pneumoniae]|nr:hypothetical protein [Klebsiella pneumoniae subsp. pneumoniae]